MAVTEGQQVSDRVLGMPRAQLADILARRTTWVAVSVVCMVIATVVTIAVIPVAADQAARRVPHAWERELGVKLSRLLIAGSQVCREAHSTQALAQVEARLMQDGMSYPFPCDVRIVHSSVKNAFAAPGGSIVIYTGLLREMDGSEPRRRLHFMG